MELCHGRSLDVCHGTSPWSSSANMATIKTHTNEKNNKTQVVQQQQQNEPKE
jgi:hypothetical protein